MASLIELANPARFMRLSNVLLPWVAGIAEQTSPRKYRFVRVRDGKTVVEAETLWVYCDATTGRPLAITPEIRDAFPVVGAEAEIKAAIADRLADTKHRPAPRSHRSWCRSTLPFRS